MYLRSQPGDSIVNLLWMKSTLIHLCVRGVFPEVSSLISLILVVLLCSLSNYTGASAARGGVVSMFPVACCWC